MPLALRDVRPLGLHDRRGHAARRHPGTDRPPHAQELASRDEAVAGIKLYNAGSFFDPRAVPESDYDDVAVALAGCREVIVESHPALVGPRVDG